MKRILFADAAISVAASLCLLTSAAQAADVPITKGPSAQFVQAARSWTGIYAGVHGGYAWNTLTANLFTVFGDLTTTLDAPFESEPNGSLFGAQIGANYEFPNHVVVGIVADISHGRMKGDTTELPTIFGAGSPVETKVGNTLWTVRGKVGYGFEKFLIYATGGIAQGNSTIRVSLDDAASGAVKHKGWVAGVGAEFRLVGNWLLGAEYRYLSLGRETYCIQGPSTADVCAPVKWQGHQAIATLNYQF
jgi:opacity protein-like surface antigen